VHGGALEVGGNVGAGGPLRADPQVVLNDDIIRIVGASDAYVQAETQRQLAEIERRRRASMSTR
jgi:predicted phosphoribosyltransferase